MVLRSPSVARTVNRRAARVSGLRWDDVELTGDLAAVRKLPKFTPSIGIVNNRVAVACDIYEGIPNGRPCRAPYLPLPQVLADALKKTAKAKQAAESGRSVGR